MPGSTIYLGLIDVLIVKEENNGLVIVLPAGWLCYSSGLAVLDQHMLLLHALRWTILLWQVSHAYVNQQTNHRDGRRSCPVFNARLRESLEALSQSRPTESAMRQGLFSEWSFWIALRMKGQRPHTLEPVAQQPTRPGSPDYGCGCGTWM